MVVLIVVALTYWLWFGLTQRSVSTDPGISILAAQGILEHGYPLLPSGFTYYKGVLVNYLVAGSVWAFGLNDFSIMLPGILLGLGSLVLLYRLAKDVFGQMVENNKDPESIVEEKGLRQLSDTDSIATAIEAVIGNSESAVKDYRAGKATAIKFLIGQVMRETRGKANPQMVEKVLKEKLDNG